VDDVDQPGEGIRDGVALVTRPIRHQAIQASLEDRLKVTNQRLALIGELDHRDAAVVLGAIAVGRRRVFLAGVFVVSAPSLAGGLAGSEAILIGARVVQGIGGRDDVPGGPIAAHDDFRRA
jgi:MFS family permease